MTPAVHRVSGRGTLKFARPAPRVSRDAARPQYRRSRRMECGEAMHSRPLRLRCCAARSRSKCPQGGGFARKNEPGRSGTCQL